MSSISPYRFAASPKHARRSTAWYASMFARGPVLDLGAGRGFFLQALRARGIGGIGVDISQEAADEAQGLGEDVIVEDGFTFLARQSDLAGIFISHVIEHLEPDRAQDLLRVAYRALAAGGLIVVVTPNPRDWMTLSDIFWTDPSHIRPYPRQLVAAMLDVAGFAPEASGLGPMSVGRRQLPSIFLNRIRFGIEYGRGEAWIRARRV